MIQTRKKWIKRWALGIIVIAIAVMFVNRAVDSFSKPEPDLQALAVTTMIVRKGDKDTGASLTGTVEGATSSIISSPVPGKVVDLSVDDGQTVHEGETLFVLDKVEMENGVLAARNVLHQAEAKYNQVETNFHRYEQLLGQGVISQQQMDTVRTELISARTEVDTARANLGTAEKRVADATIVSPSEGIVANRNLTIGQNVSAGAQVMTVENISTVNAVVQVPQKWMNEIRIGDSVDITVDTYGDRKFSGRITVVNPVAGVENRMFRVKISVPNPDFLIKPGMFISAKLTSSKPVKAILIPKTAIIQEKGISYVFVADGDRAKRISVEVGDLQGDTVEITKGLEEGQRIILDQLNRLQDKSLITWKEESR